MAACNRNTLYTHYQPVDINCWHRSDTVCFDAGPMPRDGMYDETLGLRINGNFPFVQLTLIVNQQARPSGLSRTDTIQAVVTDEDGNILGEGINLFVYNFQLPSVKLLEGDTLHVCVHHDMLRDPLPGITDLGFTLTQ